MSIKKRQIEHAREKGINRELQAGKHPDLSVVQKWVQDTFKDRPAGFPRYIFEPIQTDEVSNPDRYNQMIDNIYTDLSVAFSETGHQSDRLIAIQNVYETEEQLINMSIKEIEESIDQLEDQLHNRRQKIGYFDTFNTFDNVDFIGDPTRGLPKTNAFVDLRYGKVVLEQIQRGPNKFDLSESEYTIEVGEGAGNRQSLSPFHHALEDNINDMWEYQVTKQSTATVQVIVHVKLKEAINASMIALRLHSPRETTVKLSISEDGEIFTKLHEQTAEHDIHWQVPYREITELRFVFEKEEADMIQGTDHHYYFGVKQLYIHRDRYLQEGYLITQPYSTDGNRLATVTLETKQVIFPHTSINYYIGIDQSEEVTEWREIKPSDSLTINELEEGTALVDHHYDGYGLQAQEHFGVQYYQIGRLPHSPEPFYTDIRTGEYMWQIDSQEVTGDTHVLTLADWAEPSGVETSFISIEETYGPNSAPLKAGTIQRFQTYVYCPKKAQLFNKQLEVVDGDAKVYINDAHIQPITDQGFYVYNYSLKEGWNRIQILTFSADGGTLKPDLYLKDIGERIYADRKPLKEVPLYDLYNNTSKYNHDSFAVDNDRLIINYDPRELDIEGFGVRYDIHYYHGLEDVGSDEYFRLMAVLSHEEGYDGLSPSLLSYKIKVE